MGERGFLGTGWAFPCAFDSRTKQAALVSESKDIVQSLHILLCTKPGERVMQPTFGCGLDRMVFELIDESTVTEIRDVIEKAVLFFEPRITLDAVQVDTSRLFEGVLLLNLTYTVRSTNTRSNLVYPLYLREGTDVGHQA